MKGIYFFAWLKRAGVVGEAAGKKKTPFAAGLYSWKFWKLPEHR